MIPNSIAFLCCLLTFSLLSFPYNIIWTHFFYLYLYHSINIYEVCQESIQLFWLFWELVLQFGTNLTTNHRGPYCINKLFLIGLIRVIDFYGMSTHFMVILCQEVRESCFFLFCEIVSKEFFLLIVLMDTNNF